VVVVRDRSSWACSGAAGGGDEAEPTWPAQAEDRRDAQQSKLEVVHDGWLSGRAMRGRASMSHSGQRSDTRLEEAQPTAGGSNCGAAPQHRSTAESGVPIEGDGWCGG